MSRKFYSATEGGSFLDQEGQILVEIGIGHARNAMNSFSTNDFLIKNIPTKFSDITPNDNKLYMEKLYDYCASKTVGLVGQGLNWNDPTNLNRAFNVDQFANMYFAILTETLSAINAVNEISDIMTLANVSPIGVGDSKTFEIESKALYKVQEGAYGDLHSVYQQHLKSGITLNAKPKIASIEFDVTQMTPIGYDFGRQIAKIAASFRTKMYTDVVNLIFTVSNVSSTVYYEINFAKSTYTQMAERLQTANGGATVWAYGTNQAFQAMSDVVSAGFNVQDEKIKTGYIGDLYNIPTRKISQAVDSNTANATFRVPNNRVLLLSDIGDKPIKMVKENYVHAVLKEGKDGTYYRRVYTFIDSWNVGYITQASYGIQMV